WRRRALIVTLLVIAAAGPLFVRPARQRIDVYFDDAPSMRAREPSGTRLAEAARALVAALQAVGATDPRLISLREPGRTLTLDPRMPGGWVAAIESWAELRARAGALPTRAAFAADRAHWVVSDGADP